MMTASTFCVALALLLDILSATREATVGYGGIVASAHFDATRAGLDILSAGGTAADAAIAIQFALNVVQPHKSGIGGGAFIMYYDSTEKQVYSIDAREEAPNNYHGNIFCKNPDCFLNPYCSICGSTMSSTEKRVGGLSVGTPGTLYGLYRLYKYFGGGRYSNDISWNDLFKSAISLADDGFIMYSNLYNHINGNSNLRRWAGQDIFFRDGTATPKVSIGQIFTYPEIAETLKLLAAGNEDDALNIFYKGIIGQDIVNTVINCTNNVQYNSQTTFRNGLMTINDLNDYKAVFREPVHAKFELDGYQMYGMPMPSSGGTTILQMMQMLDIFERNHPELPSLKYSEWSSGEAAHRQTTANNVGFADRNKYMADSDFSDIPQTGLLDTDYVATRVSDYFHLTRTPTPIPYGIPPGATWSNIYNQSLSIAEDHGTTHFFAVDQWGNMAVITTTVGWDFGSCVVVPRRGIVLNNQLMGFDSLLYVNGQRVANGPEGGKKLRRTAITKFDLHDHLTFGGKRPRSSMAPMIALDTDGIPIFSAGSPGGTSIIGTVFGVMYNALIRDMDIQKAIDIGRIWSYNTNNNPSGEWSQFRNNNPDFNMEMTQRGYGWLSSSSNGRCHGVKIKKNIYGLLVFFGGADDNRWSTANVDVLCKGDGIIPDPSEFCQAINSKFLIKGVFKEKEGTDAGYKSNVVMVTILLIFNIIFF